MMDTGAQNVYNLNLNHLQSQFSKTQAPYEDSTCEEMLLYKGTSRRATGNNKVITAMKQFVDTPIDELRVSIYACTGLEVLECVYSNLQKGFQEPTAATTTNNNNSNLTQQQQLSTNNNTFRGQNTNQNLFGASNTMTTQGNMLGGLSNTQMLNSNTMFSGMGGGNTRVGGTFSNTNTMGSNLMGGGTSNSNLLQTTGGTNNLLGGNQTTTQLGCNSGGMLFQGGGTNLGQQNNTLFQNQNTGGGLFNTNNNTMANANTNTNMNNNMMMGQSNQFKPSFNTNTGIGLQSSISNPLGGGGGLTGGLGTTTSAGLFDKSNNFLLQKSGQTTNQTSGSLFAQPTTTSIGMGLNKSGGGGGLFSSGGMGQTTTHQGLGGTTTSNTFLQSGGGGMGLLGQGLSSGGLFGTTTTSGIGGGTNATSGLLGNSMGGGLGLGNTTGLLSGGGMNFGNTATTGTSSLFQPTTTATTNTLGLGLGLGSGLGLAGTINANTNSLGLTLNQQPFNVTTNNNNNPTITSIKPGGQRTFTLSTQNTTNGMNNLVVNEDELLEFRRQRQINRYVDSMRNLRKPSKRETTQLLNDTSLLQSTSKTADNILNNSIVIEQQQQAQSKYKSPSSRSGLPTSFSQITKMYTNKGLSNIQHYAQQNTRERLLLHSGSGNMTSTLASNNNSTITTASNINTNGLFETPTSIPVGDETVKLVRDALMASRRNSILNRSDMLPLLSIKTELDESIHYSKSAIKRASNKETSLLNNSGGGGDLESTRCDRCLRSSPHGNYSSQSSSGGGTHVPNNSTHYSSMMQQQQHNKGCLNNSSSKNVCCCTSTKNQKIDHSSTTKERHQKRVNDGYSTSSSTSDNDDQQQPCHPSSSRYVSSSSLSLKRTKISSHDVDPSSYGLIEDDESNNYRPTKCNITLKRPDYYTKPTLRELDELCVDGKCTVKGFVVGRKHYGFATFPDEIDLYGLNLDEIVIFNRALVEIYPDDYPNKPPQGKCLNRRAIITLYNVFPYDASENGGIVRDAQFLSSSAYIETMENLTLSLGALFLDYNPIDGTWTFEVPHFTKYGLDFSRGGADDSCSNGGNLSLLSTKQQCSNGAAAHSNTFTEGINATTPIVSTFHLVDTSRPLFHTTTYVGQNIDNDDDLALSHSPMSTKRRASVINEICESSSETDHVFTASHPRSVVSPKIKFNLGGSQGDEYSPIKIGKDNLYTQTTTITTMVSNATTTFPKCLVPDTINQYTYQPSIYASTKPYESSSVAIDNNRSLVGCFIEQQWKNGRASLSSVGNCFINGGNPIWDVASLLRTSSHIGCHSYTMAYVQPRPMITKTTTTLSLTPQVVHLTQNHQIKHPSSSSGSGDNYNHYMDPKALDFMFKLVGEYSSQKEPLSSISGIAQRKINSTLSAVKLIDEFVDYYSHCYNKSQSTTTTGTTHNSYIGPLFMLLKNLFVNDDTVLLAGDSTVNISATAMVENQRKKQLLDWIKKMTQQTVANAVHRINTEECGGAAADPYKAVKIANYYIASQRCNQATDILANNNFDQLALLSTIVHADNISKYRVGCQIDKWRQMNTLADVGDDVLTLLSIISGTSSYPTATTIPSSVDHDASSMMSESGNQLLKSSAINKNNINNNINNVVVETYADYPYWVNFDWISAFGLYLFNYCSKSVTHLTTIKEVFRCFTTATANISKEYSHCRLFNELGEDSLSRFFSKLSRSLLYLYCGNAQPFNELVDEFVVINEHYSPTIPIIWFVVVLLNELLPNEIALSKMLHVTVTTRFAELLEHNGQWNKAILVLNFIDSMPAYCRQVEDILMRNYQHHHQYADFLKDHNLIPHCNRDIIQICSVAYAKSYPFENLKMLQEILSKHTNSLESDLECSAAATAGGSGSIPTDIVKYISIIEMVLYRLNQLSTTQSHSEHQIVEDLRRKCVHMFSAINVKTLAFKLDSSH